jgi:hypothetical protein
MAPLVRLGADVNARNSAGSSALHYACHVDTFSDPVVRLLVGSGAHVGLAEDAASGGMAPLHYAAGAGSDAVCRFLVAAGADPQALDAYGRSAADCARDAQQHACAAALAALAADTPSYGVTSLGRAGISSPNSGNRSGSGSSSSGGSSSAVVADAALGRSGGVGGLRGNEDGSGGGPGGGGDPARGVSNDAAALIHDALLQIRADLQRARSAGEAQRQEYETLLRERDLAAQVR